MTQGKNYVLKAEDLVVFNCYQPYSLYYSEGAHSISLHFLPEYYLKQNIGYIDCNSALQPENAEIFERLRTKIAGIYQLYFERDEQYMLYLLSESYEMFGILKQYFEDNEAREKTSKNQKWLGEVLAYIDSNYRREITLQEIGTKFYLSEAHLSRVLKKELGMSFTEYVRTLRLNHASDLLKNSQIPITEVALESGFGYVNTFIEAFKKEFKVTPGKYRKSREKEQIRDIEVRQPIENLIKHLKGTDYERILEQKQKSKLIQLEVDTKNGKLWKHNCHNKAIKIGLARDIMYESVRNALRIAKNELDFEYLHFHGILDDSMNVYRQDSEGNYSTNFVYVDIVVDFIISLDIKPWIEIGYTPYQLVKKKQHFLGESLLDLPESMEVWEKIVEKLLQHFVTRYGRENVEQWRFSAVGGLYCFHRVFKVEQYLEYYERTYRVIRKVIPKSTITGFGLQLETITDSPNSDFSKMINFCKERAVLPDVYDFQHFHVDFSKTDRDDFEKALKYQHKAPVTVHRNAELLSQQMKLVKKILNNHDINKANCVIGSWNCGIWQKEMNNDTCFKSAFIVKNVLENTNELNEITYCNLTDHTEQIITEPCAFHGGSGLLTYQNIKKPAYHALEFLNNLDDILVERGRSYCITRSPRRNEIKMLFYHYCHDVQDEKNELVAFGSNGEYGIMLPFLSI